MSTEVVAPGERASTPDHDDVAAPPAPTRASRLRRFARSWLIDLAGVAAASTAITVWLFRLWSAPLRVPLDYAGDALAQLSVTRGIIETGWNVSNPHLGAPTGYVSYDFPAGSDNLHWLGLKVLSWFSSDAVLVTNLFFFASFVAVAVVAFVVLRVLGLPRWLAHPVALLFTFLPFHAARGIAHLALANYVSVPLGCLLVLWAAQGRPAFFEPDDGGRLRFAWRTPRALGTVVVALVLGMAGVYYAVFTVVLLAAATLLALLRPGRRPAWAPLASAALVVALVAASFGLNSLPALRYQADHGHNPGVAVREVWEVDDFALRPVQLVTPVPGHVIGALDRLGDDLRQARSNSEPTQELGSLGTIGLALALAAVVAAAAGRRRLLGVDPTIGVLILVAVLFGVVGGFSWFTSLAGLAEIRAWNRISVFIGFLALYALALALADLAGRRRGPRWFTPPIAVASAVALVMVGVADQVPRSSLRTTETYVAAWQADARFFAAVQDRLAPGTMVFELPRLSYPEEGPANGELAQEQFKPYLHTRNLNWSFGGMRGRESDWQEQVAPPVASVPDFLAAIRAVGFGAVLVDRDAYADGGAAIEGELAAALGPSVLVSEAGDWAFYDLGPAAANAQRERELARPTMWWGEGFAFLTRTPELAVEHLADSSATSIVVNHGDRPWRGRARFTVRSDAAGPFTLTITGDDQPATTVTITAADTAVELPLMLEPSERGELQWTTDAPATTNPGNPQPVAFVVGAPVFTPLT